jgi:hypothetical protein
VRRLRITILQQAVWRGRNTGLPMPLAAGYLKAAVEAVPELAAELEVTIRSLRGTESASAILQALADPAPPDMLACSVLGWNYRLFGHISTTYRQMNPEGWIVWGGNHVSGQAERVGREFPSVDVVVQGEGEESVVELARAFVSRRSPRDLQGLAGIAFRDETNAWVDTGRRTRIDDLDRIPSPFLTGSLGIVPRAGGFPYEAAILETNRGCPYSCAFCYWGGAIGQKVRSFSRARLEAEIELLARSGCESIMLCDANFGMLPEDEGFLELCIRARERFGAPRHISTSFAKQKGRRFFGIVRRMKEAGLHSSFNLALQTLTEPALDEMKRRNMRINEWEDLAGWLHDEGMDVYGELIWGCPGDTYADFLAGYDRLAERIPRIATYPLLILPNTGYDERRDELGLVTWKTDAHDFEFVLQHASMPLVDNVRMHRFLFWSRVLAEHSLLRSIWKPLREMTEITQSQVLLKLDAWVDRQPDPIVSGLRSCRDASVDALDIGTEYIERGLQYLFLSERLFDRLLAWWEEEILPHVPPSLRTVAGDLLRYDLVTLPIYDPTERAERCSLPMEVVGDRAYYVRRGVKFECDITSALRRRVWSPCVDALPCCAPTQVDIYYLAGFCSDMALYHNAQNVRYFGRIGRPDPSGTTGDRLDA